MGACYTFPSNFQVSELWLWFIKATYVCYAKHSLTYNFRSVVLLQVKYDICAAKAITC